jgi:hypothetical protein
LFCMGAKLGFSLWGRNMDWGFLRTECWWGHLDLKGRKTDRGENYIMMNFTACIFHLMLFGWLNQGEWGTGQVARMGEGRKCFKSLIRRPEGKGLLGEPRRSWQDNIKTDLKEVGIDVANWTRLAQNRVQWRAFVNYAMKAYWGAEL